MFENKEYKIEGEQKPGCLFEAKVTVTKACVQKSYKNAIKHINKEISIPGFRKGKIPEEVVVKKYPNQVEQEWKEIVLNEALQQTFDLSQIFPLSKHSLRKPKMEKCSLEEGAVIIFSYEHYPVTTSIDFSSLSFTPLKPLNVNDQEIEDVLEEIVESKATFEDVNNRPIQEGDYVFLSIEGVDDKKEIADKRRFQVTPKRMGEWMRSLLIGKGVNEVVEGESAPDPSASKEIKKNFQKTKVRITVHGIQTAKLPELNDELAVQVGTASLADLKERIAQDLLKEQSDKQNEERYFEIQDALLEKYPIDLPSSLVDDEKKARVDKKIQALKNQNVPSDEIEKKRDELEKEAEMEGKKALQLHFLNCQIASQGNISVTREDLNMELQNRMIVRSLKEIPEDVLSRFKNVLFQRKIKEYLLAQVEKT